MITSTQKIIKIGSSAGVTIPAKALKQGSLQVGDTVEISVVKKVELQTSATDSEVINAARQILDKYHQAFENLADR